MSVRGFLGTLAVAAAVAFTSFAHAATPAEHPRLLISKSDIPALRKKIQQEPFKSMAARLKADADAGNWGAGPLQSDYDHIIAAHRHGFLYVLTGDDAHARTARKYVEKVVDGKDWARKNQKGLSLYITGLFTSLTYDHCYGAPSWDAAFSDKISKKLLQQADVIFTSGGSGQNNSPASNWQALRWSSAGLAYMATDETLAKPENINTAYGRVARYMRENVGADKNSRGWNIEGLGYNYYPMGNGVVPFAVAMQRKDPAKDLRKDIIGTRYTLWTCYAALVKAPTSLAPNGLIRPDFGDDNPGTNFEGTLGWSFWLSEPAITPGLKYWYDKTVGLEGNKTFDNSRFGTVSSILYYPADVTAKDPLSIPEWRNALLEIGGNGYITFRNAYKDNTDVVGQMYVKLRGNKGHSGPDALSFRKVGLDTIWAAGGGRYGPKNPKSGQDVYIASMNTVYPADPDSRLPTNGNAGKLLGTPIIHPDGSGHAVAHIAANNVGTKNHTRWFISSFAPETGAHAAFVIADTSDDGKFWQFATLETNKITPAKDGFTITTDTGATLKATVVYPPGPLTIKTGTRARGSDAFAIKNNNFALVEGKDGDYLVVVTLAKKGQQHPAVSGSWSAEGKGQVKVGQWSATIDGENVSAK